MHAYSPYSPTPRARSPAQIYALRRLVRGLGSGRAGARQGFATALALLLSRQGGPADSTAAAAAAPGASAAALGGNAPSFVGPREVLVLLDVCLDTGGSTQKAGEARDALVGRLFGLAALSRSGLLVPP
eukprot:19364-Chlamydomonas_euryale.AAC.1